MRATLATARVFIAVLAVSCGALSGVSARAEIIQVPLTYDGFWSAAEEGGQFDTFNHAGLNGPSFECVLVVTASDCYRAVLEFDLGGIAPESEIISATLHLARPTEGMIAGLRTGSPVSVIELYGFPGDGVPDPSDAAADNLLCRFELHGRDSLDALYDPIDLTAFIQSQTASGDCFVGFTLRGANGGFMNVMKGDSILSVSAVPEPSAFALIALALLGVVLYSRYGRS
jgi:hypothetical protein